MGLPHDEYYLQYGSAFSAYQSIGTYCILGFPVAFTFYSTVAAQTGGFSAEHVRLIV
jgi:hypothetical protein